MATNAPRILFVVTNHGELGDTGKETGWFLPEVAHPYHVLTEEGFQIDFASPQGGSAPLDPSSKDLDDEQNRAFYEEHVSEDDTLEDTLSPSEIDPNDYGAVFYAGGHGTMWDFPANEKLAQIAATIYDRGGVVSAVCHGPAALVNLKLPNGEYLIDGKRVSAFTNEEERDAELDEVVPFLLVDRLEERGATHVKSDPWQECVEVDDRLVTGQNPASAHGVGEEIARHLKTTSVAD